MPEDDRPISRSSTAELSTVFTAQSKRFFYCRDVICAYVFSEGCVPVNPFRAFEYFLHDRVNRDLVRQGNNNLIRVTDELWVFGDVIADGVFFEIIYAQRLEKPIRFYTIGTRIEDIHRIPPEALRFEPSLYRGSWRRESLIELVSGRAALPTAQQRLFDPDAPRSGDSAEVLDLKRFA